MRSIDHHALPGPFGPVDSLLHDGDWLPSEAAGLWRQFFPEIIGCSLGIQKVLEAAYKVARSDSSVLILGESGTGKELIAAAIHRLSHRADRPYVPLNCSAIPESLLESDLFGHERGAFTGADRRRPGKFEYAEGGTIFLDEIGDMAHSLQAKLLRVLQDKKFAPLGGNELREVNIRIIAATNKDLQEAVRKSEFRLDLYYRLNVLPIYIPPLRERREDIPALVQHFVDLANRSQSRRVDCYVTDELMGFLRQYSWPGNIRQLQNLVERMVVMRGGGALTLEDLPREIQLHEPNDGSLRLPHISRERVGLLYSHSSPISPNSGTSTQDFLPGLPEEGLDLTSYIENLENQLIKQALERTGNNRNQAAKLLGLNRTTLVERIKKRRLTALNDPSKEL